MLGNVTVILYTVGLSILNLHSVQVCSAFFLSDISVRSPRKIFCFHYLKKYILDQSIQKNVSFDFEKGSTVGLSILNIHSVQVWRSTPLRWPDSACTWVWKRRPFKASIHTGYPTTSATSGKTSIGHRSLMQEGLCLGMATKITKIPSACSCGPLIKSTPLTAIKL